MKKVIRSVRRDERGMTLAEVMVGLVLFMVGMVGLLGATATAAGNTIRAKSDLHWWAVVQWKADSLISVGADNVTSGSDDVGDLTLTWWVAANTTPLRVDLVIDRPSTGKGAAVTDSVVLFLTK